MVEQHAFRQTQTALSTYWISKSPLTTLYQTPTLRSPWSIPFEFPIYEYAVSCSASLRGSDLRQTGRLVSYAFLLLCLLPVGSILRRLCLRNLRGISIAHGHRLRLGGLQQPREHAKRFGTILDISPSSASQLWPITYRWNIYGVYHCYQSANAIFLISAAAFVHLLPCATAFQIYPAAVTGLMIIMVSNVRFFKTRLWRSRKSAIRGRSGLFVDESTTDLKRKANQKVSLIRCGADVVENRRTERLIWEVGVPDLR